MHPAPSHLKWQKSTYSSQSGNCVEVANLPGGGRAVRDSKDPNGPTLDFTADEWRTFIGYVKNSEIA
ncbi:MULTISPECIES: DUF397 domain-containing protein [unclassified Streptosporangium]|uniref:DUF397 domain-containing protein n=1 Tax=unclassified Streptosporangium TaxID=2632669 RepID=UPI002E295E9A|nr:MULTISPECIES: DUF397 domain-containing protein [unclassified Streptosporangium]